MPKVTKGGGPSNGWEQDYDQEVVPEARPEPEVQVDVTVPAPVAPGPEPAPVVED